MEFKSFVCEICGGTTFIEKSNVLICTHCDATYHKQTDEETEEEKEAQILRVSRLDDAEKELRMSPPHFDMAEDKFSELIKQYPNWSAGYWGVLRSKYGIKYEIDFDGKIIPSCYKSSYEDFRDDIYFKRALKYAETAEIKAKYQEEGDRIAQTCKEWREKAKEFDYDIFISFKARENGQETKDLREMQDLYTYLTEQGYKVFFSHVSMRSNVGKKDWDAYIFNALDKSSVMILYGSNVDYFSSTWIENEWTRYLRMIGKGLKNPDSLIVAYDGIDPNALPRQLRKLQAINAADKTFYITLTERLKDIFAKEYKHATIDRIEVKSGNIGKKVASITETVEIMEAGTAKVSRKTSIAPTEVSKRNVASSAGIYVPSANETVQMGLSLLRLGSFFEADMFLTQSINENKQNGTAWLGLLCTKLNDEKLYDDLTAPQLTYFSDIKKISTEIINCFEELTNSVEYATDRFIAENILEYLFTIIKCVIHIKKPFAGLDKIFSFVIQYDSNVYDQVLDYMIKYMTSIATISSEYEYEYMCNEVLKRTSDTDTYLAVIEKVINGYAKVENISKAKSWNEKLLELDSSNLKAVYRSICYFVNVFDMVDFNTAQLALSAKDIIPFVKEAINHLSRKDAEKLLDTLSETERFCVSTKYFDNAECYFDFITKFKFPNRDTFLEQHEEDIKALANNHRIDFFEKFMSAMSHENVDWHIDNRLEYANQAKISGYFADAKKIYDSILQLEETNVDAMSGILSCDLSFNGTDTKSIEWNNFNVSQFEKILSSCANKRKQVSILKQYTKACVSYVKGDAIKKSAKQVVEHICNVCGESYNPKYLNSQHKCPTCKSTLIFESQQTQENEQQQSPKAYDACCQVFDQLVKYFPESESKTLFGYVDELAAAFLAQGKFSSAITYANLSIGNEPTYNIKARSVILLATLECKDKEDFVRCEKFNKNLTEYKMLLLSCRSNPDALQEYTSLAKKNEEVVKQIRQEKQKAAEAEERKKELDRLAMEQQEKEKAEMLKQEKDANLAAGLISLIPSFVFFMIWMGNHEYYYDGEGFFCWVTIIAGLILPSLLIGKAILLKTGKALEVPKKASKLRLAAYIITGIFGISGILAALGEAVWLVIVILVLIVIVAMASKK